MQLYTDGTSEADQTDLDAAQGTITQAAVNAWIVAQAPKLDALVQAGDVTITPVASDGDSIAITFDETATGDRKIILQLLAGLTGRWHGTRPDPEAATWEMTKSHAQEWAQTAQGWLALW